MVAVRIITLPSITKIDGRVSKTGYWELITKKVKTNEHITNATDEEEDTLPDVQTETDNGAGP